MSNLKVIVTDKKYNKPIGNNMKRVLISAALLSTNAIALDWTIAHTKAMNKELLQYQGVQVSENTKVKNVVAANHNNLLHFVYSYDVSGLSRSDMDESAMQKVMARTAKSSCKPIIGWVNKFSNLNKGNLTIQYLFDDYSETIKKTFNCFKL